MSDLSAPTRASSLPPDPPRHIRAASDPLPAMWPCPPLPPRRKKPSSPDFGIFLPRTKQLIRILKSSNERNVRELLRVKAEREKHKGDAGDPIPVDVE